MHKYVFWPWTFSGALVWDLLKMQNRPAIDFSKMIYGMSIDNLDCSTLWTIPTCRVGPSLETSISPENGVWVGLFHQLQRVEERHCGKFLAGDARIPTFGKACTPAGMRSLIIDIWSYNARMPYRQWTSLRKALPIVLTWSASIWGRTDCVSDYFVSMGLTCIMRPPNVQLAVFDDFGERAAWLMGRRVLWNENSCVT